MVAVSLSNGSAEARVNVATNATSDKERTRDRCFI
jgi:hypothetical protein